ncbi:MAG: hypothetical protein COT91_02230 [Candidatus Doudnabacteria bacterium CG10_big_fil_rev_8_21_14_0_10_41_10]|uniref:Uncharacterized protein n=1 Tax=Candidatus Doudnabacteria bacterium CG10_big_fil_rev_8_21_14_0_10_41_10 TaxID=1974551 RepID=A0A2H0VDW4_9BACT|nr:MAG: hypothetical protein COT91_02230 [Candidatus Doudnabacteria bacterium CG10_big_fil_rev_8_21_14_0_10_41_10]
MALAKIVKINLIAHKKFQDKIWKTLQDSGLMEVAGVNQNSDLVVEIGDQISKLDYQLAGVKFSLTFLSDFDKSKKSFNEKINSSIEISDTDIVKTAQTFGFELVVKQVQEAESQINEAKNHIDKNRAERNLLVPWKKLSFAPNNDRLSENYGIKYLSMSQDGFKEAEVGLAKASSCVEVKKVDSSGKDVWVYVVYRKVDESALQEVLNLVKAKPYELPNLNVTVEEQIVRLEQGIKANEGQIEKLHKLTGEMAKHIDNLKIVYDYLNWQKIRLQTSLRAGQSWQTFSAVGWIDERAIKPLEEQIEKITKDFSIEKIALDPEEVPPVKFKNTWARSFESVTEIYGSPQSHEPDPTPFLAPFFTIFFGLALTDAGYGLVMALGIPLAMKLLRIPKGSRKLLWVLFWGGVSSFILGAFTGGWFSIDLTILPSFIGGPLQTLQVINPLENALSIFYISLGLGVIQVLFGLGINTWWKIKSGEAREAILGSGMWILAIVSLLVFVGSSAGLLPVALKTGALWVVYATIATLVVGKALQAKNFFVGLPSGVLGLYDIVGYFSDVLSYSRLLALGLTTGIIGMVVNLIAALVMGIPFVGWLFGLVILIGGHIFNLGINALGAFIHSGRLQYIEFFPKFMEGGGKPFTPLARESAYVRSES